MTDQRHHLTTEDFAERTPNAAGADGRRVEPDRADRDGFDRNGFDREPSVFDEPAHDKPLHGQAALTGEPLVHDETARDGLAHAGTTRDGTVDDETVYETPQHETVQDETAQDETAHDETAHREPVEPAAVDTTAGDAPLFTPDDAADYQAEWRALQADFVDDPREAVQRADELVAQVMQTLATTFNEHKHALEEQWQRGDEVQTEELRQALKRYRTFFDRLLSV